MTVLAPNMFQQLRAGRVEGELIALSRPQGQQPQVDDEVAVMGLRYRVAFQLWAATGVMGAIVLLRVME